MEKYIKPEFREKAFTCPHCGVHSQIKWYEDRALELRNPITEELFEAHCFAQCECCKGVMYFTYRALGLENDDDGILIEKTEGTMIYPKQIIIPPAEDMPEHIKKTYKEASLVLQDSPRATCALLRLALQELMAYLKDHYEEYRDLTGKDINKDIGTLVKHCGLSPKIQKALDSIRITGNNVLHLGELNIDDNQDIPETLFKILNFIVKEMITQPKEIEGLYEKMPEKERGWVLDRDKNQPK